MKIAFISSVFLPVRCGLSNAIYNLSKNFIKKGHDVTVIIPYYPLHKKFPLEERICGVRLLRFLFPEEFFFRRSTRNKLFRWVYIRELLAFPVVTLKLINLLKDEKFDIVNLQFTGCSTPSVLIAKEFIKFRLVVTLQGYSSHILPYGGWFNRWIYKKALKKADFLTAISEYVLDEACKIEPRVKHKSAVIPNGMDFGELELEELDRARYLSSIQSPPDEYIPRDKKRNKKIEEPFILSIGSLCRFNGMDLLITAFRDVLGKGHRCNLVIIGDGYERRYLDNLITLLRIDGRAHILSGLGKDIVDKLVERSLFYIRTPRIDPIGEIYPGVLEQGKTILTINARNGVGDMRDKIIAILNNRKQKFDFAEDNPSNLISRHCEALTLENVNAEAISNDKRDCFVGLRPPRNDSGKSYLKIRSSSESDLQFRHEWENNKNPSRPYIFSLGRFVGYKRFDILIRAFKNVTGINPDIDLLIGGEGGELNYLQKLILSLGLEERVYFLGFLDRERVIKLYKGCELFAATFENEPFGVVVLEAMAAGKPVIVPRTGAMPELVRDGLNGIMVEPGSEIELADGMVRLLKDKNLRDRLGSEARLSIGEKYSWDSIAERYVSKFRDLSIS